MELEEEDNYLPEDEFKRFVRDVENNDSLYLGTTLREVYNRNVSLSITKKCQKSTLNKKKININFHYLRKIILYKSNFSCMIFSKSD